MRLRRLVIAFLLLLCAASAPHVLSPTPRGADAAPPPVAWHADWLPGGTDDAGEFMGGTETMRLVAHEGLLFAGTGFWTDVPGDDPRPGGQILVKRSPDAPWTVERSFANALRVNAMESLTFTIGHDGAALAAPVPVLIADAASMQSRSRGPLDVFVRDDANGRWVRSRIAPDAPRAYVRAFGCHRDQETGVELVFAGTGAGEIYAGSYDPSEPGGIRWNPVPEYRNPDFDGTAYRRVSGFCAANGQAFSSVSPQLVRREDGTDPAWSEVFEWSVVPDRAGAGLRGITAVKSPGGDHQVILGAREQPGHILRIDPLAGFAAEIELESRVFLSAQWGAEPIAGGLTAYNRFVPGEHPVTGAPIHWVTIAAIRRDDPQAAWLLVRNGDASYEVVRVFDQALADHPTLISTRTVELSPWSDDKLYTGGYDGAANDRQNHNTAWIFEGRLSLEPDPDQTPEPTPTSADETPLFDLTHTDDTPAMKSTALVDSGVDNMPHLAMARSGGYTALRNDGDGRFTRAFERASRNSTGWGVHDFDGDGATDLFLTQNTEPDGLFHMGDGGLASHDVGLEGEGVVRTAIFADYDGDGVTDAYLSTSAFGARHDWNQLRRGLPEGGFGPNVIDEALDPPRPGFWHALADGPNGCEGEWSNKQFKGAVTRDFDGDGLPDIIATAYADRGYQDDRCKEWAQGWVEQQDRGVFVLHNRSTPGRIRFAEVGLEAVGPDAHGSTTSHWNPYHAVPLDYDRDGDLDLFVGAVLRPDGRGGSEDTRSVMLLENVSAPDRLRFADRTADAGLDWLNALPVAARAGRSLAAGAPIDFDNDGWVDLALVNRRDIDKTPHAHVHLFRNRGTGRFEEIPSQAHGLVGGGGREIAYGDLDADGRLDLVVNDGTAGGYDGANESRVYFNRTPDAGNWIAVRAVSGPNASPAIGAKVRIRDLASGAWYGFDEVRTDFSYRSKRLPTLHFGVGDARRVEACILLPGSAQQMCSGDLPVNTTVVLDVDELDSPTRAHLPVAWLRAERARGTP